MYVERKKISGKEYLYAKISVRKNSKVKTKTVAYLGKAPMTKKQLQEKISKIPKSKVMLAREELAGSFEDITKDFLSKEQLERINEIRKVFKKKLKTADKKLIEDMFKDFKTYYIYNTNSIEGNSLTLEETNLLLNKNQTPKNKDLREIYDHINERDVFDDLLTKKPKLTIPLIIDMHQRLLKNIDVRVGSFRTGNVRIFGATVETSDAKYVHIDMGLLMKWYKNNRKKLHPLVLAAIFHEKFEKIHPFYDGNGRCGRMIMNLMLLQNALPPLIVTNKHRMKYYKALSEGHKTDLTKTQQEHKAIVKFCYKQFIETHEKIFSKWG